MRLTQNVYHPRMPANENPEPKKTSSGWTGVVAFIAVCVTVIIVVQMITDYRW